MNIKFIAILSITIFALSFSACGKEEEKGTQELPTVESVSPTTRPALTPNTSPTTEPNEKLNNTTTPVTKPNEKPVPTQAPSTGNAGAPPPTQAPTPEPTQAPSLKPSQEPIDLPKVELKLVIDKVKAEVRLPMLQEVSINMVRDIYYFDTILANQTSAWMPMMTATATEIAIFEAKDEKALQIIKSGIEKRDKQLKGNTHYPSQMELINKSKLVTKGNYILYVIAEDADKIVSIFNSFIK